METRNIDITPGGQMQSIHASQNDVGRQITLNVTDGSGWYDLTGCTVKLEGVKPSGLGYSVTGTVNGHTVTITTTKQMTDEAGNIASELKITKNNMVLGAANINLEIETDPHPDSTTDGSADELISEITILVERVEAAVAKEEVLHEAEAWAVGKRNGVPVGSEDDTYHNNAKYYSDEAGAAAEAAAQAVITTLEEYVEDGEAYALGTRDGTPVGSSDPTYHNNSKYYKEQSEDSAEDAEAWAIGKRGGSDVSSSDETYHNNSKYYSAQAAASADSAAASAALATGMFTVDPATRKVTMHITVTE